jgi:hypothetical protein
MLSALSAAGAEVLVVGDHALAAHGYPRATGDLDIWVRPTGENADRVCQAIVNYGAPRRHLSRDDFCTPDTVYQIGVAPNRIDILTSIDGVEFDEAWANRKQVSIDDLTFFVIGRDQLLKNKREAGRPKDMADVAWLEELGQ